MKIFHKSLIIFLVVFSSFFCFAITECELAKKAISNDVVSILNFCESKSYSIHNYLDPICNPNLVYQYWNGSEFVEEPLQYMGFYDPNSGESVYDVVVTTKAALYELDNFTNSVTRECKDVFYQLSLINCSGSNVCNCAEYLVLIRQDVSDIKFVLEDYLNEFDIHLSAIYSDIYNNFHDLNLPKKFENIFQYHNFVTNFFSALPSSSLAASVGSGFRYMSSQGSVSTARQNGIFQSISNYKSPSYNVLQRLSDFMSLNLQALWSLNNYSWTNYYNISSIYKSSISNNVALGTISRQVDRGFDVVTNQFSIFIESSSGASPVLGAYTENDGSYHDYLTNYYIKVSGSSVSGSTPLTNWFNRIEMLLAALVFQDDDGPDTNSVPPSSSFDDLDSELTQNMTTINQQGEDYLSAVDTSGRSLLSMLREWNSAVTGISRPSPFVIVSIPSSAQSSPSRSESSLEITLDTDNKSLSGFVEVVRGVTTLAWVTLFLVVGYFLSIRIITLIGKLISFGYSVYSAVFGGG